jgi:glutaredoxin
LREPERDHSRDAQYLLKARLKRTGLDILICERVRAAGIEPKKMGKIVVFTTPHDIHSQRVRRALEKRELPFAEIDVSSNPQTWRDLCDIVASSTSEGGHAASMVAATIPAVFVGSTLVGGVRSTLRLLRGWDKDERYACALEKYEMEVDRPVTASTTNSYNRTAARLSELLARLKCEDNAGDLSHSEWTGYRDPAKHDDLSVDDERTSVNDIPLTCEVDRTRSTAVSFCRDSSSSSSSSEQSSMLVAKRLWGDSLTPPANIPLPDGTRTTYCGVTETLRSVLTLSDVVHKGTQYRNCFSGAVLVEAVGMTMRLTHDQAVQYCDELIRRHRVIVQVPSSDNPKAFNGAHKSLYRLQCYATPDVLNSYKMMIQSSSEDDSVKFLTQLSPLEVVDALDAFLSDLEFRSLNSRCKIDYSELVLNDRYPEFEESVCALQVVDMAALDEDGRLAFAINLYRLMVRYAFTKVGYFANEDDRIHFMKSVKFNVGGMIFSLQQWIDGILRANRSRRAGNSFLASLSGRGCALDKRSRRLSMAKMDWRVHFAAHCHPAFGSRVSLPFRSFSAANIHEDLETVVRVSLQDWSVMRVDKERNVLKLSRIFQWYKLDFAPNLKALIARISEYVPDPSCLQEISKTKYLDVPWTTNAISHARFQRDVVVGQVTAVAYMLMGRFKPPPTPCNEKLRVATLRSLNLLDTTTTDERINRITNTCQAELQAPIACVTLVDASRQWFKSAAWECSLPPVPETPKDISFCGHAVAGSPDDILVVEDASKDDRFADNPFVAGDFGARFYVGIPLSFRSGGGVLVNIGTLCVIDFKPRRLADAELELLRHYASLVKQEILRLDDGSTDLCSRCSESSLESEGEGDDDPDNNGIECMDAYYNRDLDPDD